MITLKQIMPALMFSLVVLTSIACGNEKEPFTAEARFYIDSVANENIRRLKLESDSLCQINKKDVLPRLVDSIHLLRMRQMQEKLGKPAQ